MKKTVIYKESKEMEIQKDLNKELSITQEKLQAIQYELKKQNLLLDEKVNHRTSELQRQINELNLNLHFTITCK